MELNVCKRGEPSHIHIRRPSREQAARIEASDEQPERTIAREVDEQSDLT
jgi:hypothetical protein